MNLAFLWLILFSSAASQAIILHAISLLCANLKYILFFHLGCYTTSSLLCLHAFEPWCVVWNHKQL